MNRAICGDNRFEIIEKAKQAILEETNIKDDKAQMAELDSFLFRCWQMGWLKKYEEKETNEGQALLYAVEKTAERTKRETIERAIKWFKWNWRCYVNGPDKDGVMSFGHWEKDFRKSMQDESRRLD